MAVDTNVPGGASVAEAGTAITITSSASNPFADAPEWARRAIVSGTGEFLVTLDGSTTPGSGGVGHRVNLSTDSPVEFVLSAENLRMVRAATLSGSATAYVTFLGA